MTTRLGTYIRTKRLARKLSRRAFVELMPEETRINESTLANIERGNIIKPPKKRLEGFSIVLGISVTVLQNLLIRTSVITVVTASAVLFPKELKAIEDIQRYEPKEGYHVGFSGGKDSIVTLNLVRKAAVKHKAYYTMTTIDPPELMHFIRTYYPDVVMLRPKVSMFKMISETKHSLPTRQNRYCCAELKEYAGKGEFTILGIRKEESNARSDRKLFEHDTRAAMAGKMYLNPIIDWNEADVWEYIYHYKLNYPSLYDVGFTRLGCVGCPQASKNQRRRELERYPRYKEMYLKAIRKAMKARRKNGTEYAISARFEDEYDVFEWWLSDLSIEDYHLSKRQLKLF